MTPHSPTYTRREVLKLAGLTLVMQTFAGAAEVLPDGAFEFIVVNDTHYFDDLCRPWHARVVGAMRESCPEAAFSILVGDVSDRGTAEACVVMRDLYHELGCPFYTVPGNHDHISDSDRSGYESVFPGKDNYHFAHQGWQFVALDSTDGKKAKDTEISSTTLAWLDENLPQLDAHKPTFVFTHFPVGEGMKMRPVNADSLVSRVAKMNVRWVHCGHWHGESESPLGDSSITTSRCCARIRENHDGSPLKGWHVYRAAADGTLSRRFVQIPTD